MIEKFSVIIPCYKNPEYLDLCLKSIVRGQTEDNEIIVVLDGFSELYEGFDKRFPKVGFLPLSQNMGMQHAINIGVFNATNERIFIVNDDNVFPLKWDEKLKCCLRGGIFENDVVTVNQIEPTGPGMFEFEVRDCGRTVSTFDFAAFDKACEDWDDVECEGTSIYHTNDGRIFPFIISKVDFMAVNGFDTFYQSPNVVDWDFFLKLELIKKSFFRVRTAHLYHFGSVATKKNEDKHIFTAKEMDAHKTFMYKWGFPPSNGIYNSKLPKESVINGIRYK